MENPILFFFNPHSQLIKLIIKYFETTSNLPPSSHPAFLNYWFIRQLKVEGPTKPEIAKVDDF